MTPERLTWRTATAADAPALAALARACAVADRDPFHYTESEIVDDLADPANEAVTARNGDGLVAAGWTHVNPDATRENVVRIEGEVAPERRGEGIGAALLSRLETRARERSSGRSSPHQPMLHAYVFAHHNDAVRLYEQHGYTPVRWWWEMSRDLSAPIPALATLSGVVVTPWSEDLDDEVLDVRNEAFADHWGSEPMSATRWRDRVVGGRNFARDLSTVAVDEDGRTAGYLATYLYPDDWEFRGSSYGYIASVGVRRAHRGRGIASALLTGALHAYADRGFDEATLGVDADNPSGALGLYRRLGFVTQQRSVTYEKPALDREDPALDDPRP